MFVRLKVSNEESIVMKSRSEVLTAVTMELTAFCDVTRCSPVEIYRYFEGMCCLHPQDKRVSRGGICMDIWRGTAALAVLSKPFGVMIMEKK
jgi:hypothetical protein